MSATDTDISQRNISRPTGGNGWSRWLQRGRNRSGGGFRMWVKRMFTDAGNDEASRTLGDGHNGAQNTRKIGYWDINTTTAEPMEANSCETALYRGSGRLFRPRPGLPK